MDRTNAAKILRQTLDDNNLKDWHIRLSTKDNSSFYGLCSFTDKTIILNAFYIDTAPEPIVLNTIRHEVAHALLDSKHGHDEVWQAKAKELGCHEVSPCSSFSISPIVLDAIRSNADVKIEFEEVTRIVPKYTIHRLQDKCIVCGKIAKIKSTSELNGLTINFFECGHCEFVNSSSLSPFEKMVFDEDVNCNHKWGIGKFSTVCNTCNAKKLYQFQVDGARLLEKANGRFGIFDQQGLGKTIQALAYLKYNLENGAAPYLWVTKSKVKYQHCKEILRLLGPTYFPFVLTNGKSTFVEGFKGYLMSYDLFRRIDLSLIEKASIQTIVLDECQAIKNPDSKRTQSVRDACKTIPKIICLSGTPWKNRGSELFVALNLLDPKMFWSYAGFKSQWVRTIVDESGKEREGGINNPEKFRELTKHIIVRRERKQVANQLPFITKRRTKLFCEVPEHARAVYNEEANKIKAIMKYALIDGTEGSFAVQSKLQQSIITMRQIVGLAKVASVVEYLEEFLEDNDTDKIICFVHHIKVGELIYEQMKTFCNLHDIEAPIRLLGNTSAESTGDIQDEFNTGKSRLLVASTLSAGEGLNLQKKCHTILMAERQWNPANEEQAEDRVCRIGQDEDLVDCIYALGDKTVDTTLDKLVEFKRMEFENSHNVEGYALQWDESSIFKEMIKAIVEG